MTALRCPQIRFKHTDVCRYRARCLVKPRDTQMELHTKDNKYICHDPISQTFRRAGGLDRTQFRPLTHYMCARKTKITLKQKRKEKKIAAPNHSNRIRDVHIRTRGCQIWPMCRVKALGRRHTGLFLRTEANHRQAEHM